MVSKLSFLLLLVLITPAHAQLSATHAGGVAGGGGPPPPPPTYTGPGNITTFRSWWSNTRAYSTATAGNPLIRVCNSSGGVDNGPCADMVTDATTGILVPATVGSPGTSCPGASCTILTYYDQAGGANNCTQSTITARMTLSQWSVTLPGGIGNTTATYNCTAIAQATPWSVWTVSNQPTSASGVYDGTVQENGASFPGLFTSQSPSQLKAACGVTVAVSVTFPNSFAWAFMCPSAGNGTLWVNAVGTTANFGNTALVTAGYTLHNWRNNPGTYAEGGVVAGDITSTISSLTSNARSFYGF